MAWIITLSLAAGAIAYQGHHAWLAFDPDDTNHLETPLLLATARQLADGPATLYGPFSGSDPLVLIHAPLYYRLSALIAWPIAKAGVDPVAASMVAARGLAFLGFAIMAFAAWWIARMDGGSRLAGAWSALLVAGSPVVGSFGFTVRPDTLGVAFQTLGFGLVLRSLLRGQEASAWGMLAAGVLLGLAACVKQHLLVAAGVASLMLVVAIARGRVRKLPALAALAVGVAVPIAYYAWEESVTGGRMSRSVFVLPSRLRTLVPPPDPWGHVLEVFVLVAKLGSGSIALGLALLLTSAKSLRGTSLDAALWLVFAAEVAAMVPLCLGSEGAWVNYAMPAAAWGAILAARACGRALQPNGAGWAGRLAVVLASFLAAFVDFHYAEASYTSRREAEAEIRRVLDDPAVSGVPPESRYFVAMPQGNRLHGNVALAHDEWLYQSYEKLDMAEPRRVWLREALAGKGPIRVVVVPSASEGADLVSGLPWPLPMLGYHVQEQVGPYAVWVR